MLSNSPGEIPGLPWPPRKDLPQVHLLQTHWACVLQRGTINAEAASEILKHHRLAWVTFLAGWQENHPDTTMKAAYNI